MRILITNDDGFNADGLKLLEALARHFSDDIIIAAPTSNQTGKGRSISLYQDIECHQLDDKRYLIGGTPADCVILAVNHLCADQKPDLVLSGINHGMNIADDTGYSGTVGGAMEGAVIGIPSIALSQKFPPKKSEQSQPDFTPARQAGQKTLALAIDLAMAWASSRAVINVNFPTTQHGRVKGIRQAPLDNHKGSDQILSGHRPNSYRIGKLNMRAVTPHTDRWWLEQGYITLTPLALDMTAAALMGHAENSSYDFPLD